MKFAPNLKLRFVAAAGHQPSHRECCHSLTTAGLRRGRHPAPNPLTSVNMSGIAVGLKYVTVCAAVGVLWGTVARLRRRLCDHLPPSRPQFRGPCSAARDWLQAAACSLACSERLPRCTAHVGVAVIAAVHVSRSVCRCEQEGLHHGAAPQ